MFNKKETELCKQYYNEKHEEYVKSQSHVSLDSFLTTDYSLGYSDVYPITDDLEKILKIESNEVKFYALNLRYKNPTYPTISKGSEKDFTTLYQFGSKFLSEHPEWMETYASISNFIDELIEKSIILNDDTFAKNDKASSEEIIKGALPYIAKIFISKGSRIYMQDDLKNYITWLAEFSQYKDEFSKLKNSLKDEDYMSFFGDGDSSSHGPQMI